MDHLERPFVHYVATNLPLKARDHFHGLQEAKKDLVGLALFDRLDKQLQADPPLVALMWRSCEIENYLCSEHVLVAYAQHDLPDDLFGIAERQSRIRNMHAAIKEVSDAIQTLGKPDPWSPKIKATDDVLDPLFKCFFKKLGLPLGLRKSDYHMLATHVPKDRIDPEVTEKLDAIVNVARRATPRAD